MKNPKTNHRVPSEIGIMKAIILSIQVSQKKDIKQQLLRPKTI